MSSDTSPEVVKLVDRLDVGMKVVEMPIKTEGERNKVPMMLNEAMAENFDEIVILGLSNKDNSVNIKSSNTISTARLLGYIEIAKHHLMGL